MNTTTNEVKFERNCFMFGEELTAVIGLPSKTLIYRFMEQHHCLCSERDYWYRNSSSQWDYTIAVIIVMLQSFFDFARLRFLPLTGDQANVGSEYVYIHIRYKHWLHLPRYRQLFKVSTPFPTKYIYNIAYSIYIYDSLSLSPHIYTAKFKFLF